MWMLKLVPHVGTCATWSAVLGTHASEKSKRRRRDGRWPSEKYLVREEDRVYCPTINGPPKTAGYRRLWPSRFSSSPSASSFQRIFDRRSCSGSCKLRVPPLEKFGNFAQRHCLSIKIEEIVRNWRMKILYNVSEWCDVYKIKHVFSSVIYFHLLASFF